MVPWVGSMFALQDCVGLELVPLDHSDLHFAPSNRSVGLLMLVRWTLVLEAVLARIAVGFEDLVERPDDRAAADSLERPFGHPPGP